MRRDVWGLGGTFGCGMLAVMCAMGKPRPAAAVPLDIETCDKLVQQEAELERAGARANLARGPQWAKTNLPQDKIEQVRQLIEIQEQVAFRCLRTKPLPAESLVPQVAPAPVAAGAVPAKPKPRPVVAKAKAPDTAAAPGETAQPAPPPKPRPVVKAPAPKSTDVYVPAPRVPTGTTNN